ncbi:MAG: phenylalanine--tRNA ligase subunit alpha [Euryarchaeota archaeon]|nr:phenylalanine--tRNA ligase subunit alpha [Euryarchaeota archaeon]
MELSNQEKRVLVALHKLGPTSPQELLKVSGLTELVEVMNGASWLRAKGLLKWDEKFNVSYRLTDEGRELVNRLPERRLFRLLEKNGGTVLLKAVAILTLNDGPDRKILPEEIPIAVGWLKRKGLAEITKDGVETMVRTRPGAEIIITPDEKVMTMLAAAPEGVPESDLDSRGVNLLLGRQNILKKKEETAWRFELTDKGRAMVEAGIDLQETVSQITPELIQSGAWKTASIRAYDVASFAPPVYGGKTHPMRRIVDDIRRIFLSMGFTEIGGPFVRSCFWDMDVLFVPQDHPAREMQDTFYLSNPAKSAIKDRKLLDRVKGVHESGKGVDSTGWGYKWSEAEGSRMILRTHTTVDTISHLAKHNEPPVKAFAIGRVFRKEAMDATHLPEFHQVEGIVMEEGANLRELIGLLREFFQNQMGFEEVRVRPGYFPYTEPSLEVDVRFRGKWLELGGAGIFRPEVTRPIGCKAPVLAWGLGLERLAMLKLGLTDIRDLYLPDIDWLRNAPVEKTQ